MDKFGVDFQDLWHALGRRKFQLVLAVGLGGAIALAINEALPVHYTSEALLQVQVQPPLMREMNPAALATTPDQVRTEVDILQSRALQDAVIRDLHLADTPNFKAETRTPTWLDWIVIGLQRARTEAEVLLGVRPKVDRFSETMDLFQRRLQVLSNEKSHIVNIRFQTGSPQLSADVVNHLVTGYLTSQVSANVNVAAQENQWLTDHLGALQRAVDDAAQRAQAFRDANGLVDIMAGSLPAVQLNDKQQALSIARQDLSKAQVAFVTASRAMQTGSGFSGQEALNSLLIQRLRDREADVLQRLANLRERSGPNSPYLPPVQAELDSVRRQIAGETTKIVSALRRDVELARDRVSTLQAAVTDSQGQARQNVAATATLAQLNQEVEAKRHVYIAFLTRMEQTQLASTKFPAGRVVSPGVPPYNADGLPSWLVGVLGAVAAAFLTIATILLRQVLGGRITSAKDLELLTGVAPIGSMPALPGAADVPIAMRILSMSQSGTVETLHALGFAVRAMNPKASCTHVLVTSSLPEEGKTTLASSLARLSASSGMRVLLVEADLRRPTLSRMLRVSSGASIESLLTNKSRLADAVYVDAKSGLHCLVANGSTSNVVAALQSPRFGALMEEARANYDMVVIDSPPVMRVIDPLILSEHSDVILFAVACGSTSASTVAEALRRFPSEVQSRIATVLTRVSQSDEAWRGYYAGYQRKQLSLG